MQCDCVKIDASLHYAANRLMSPPAVETFEGGKRAGRREACGLRCESFYRLWGSAGSVFCFGAQCVYHVRDDHADDEGPEKDFDIIGFRGSGDAGRGQE